MTERALVATTSKPRLGDHMRLRFDKTREQWTIQAPERSFMLDTVAYAVVSRCNGTASIATIIEELCGIYTSSSKDLIEHDVLKLIQEFADKGVMTI